MASTGVIIVNTGTPDELTEEAIRDFLRSMLSDPMLISVPPFIWKRILEHFILPNRPKKTILSYAKVWDEDGSLFINISKRQRAALEQELVRRGFDAGQVNVELCMRYSHPLIEEGLAKLKQQGVVRVVCVPLYPQYVNVCAGTCLKEFDRCLAELVDDSWNPTVCKVTDFYQNMSYRSALAASVKRVWQPKEGSKLVVSFHSTVMSDIDAGDPYKEQTEATAKNLAADLGMDPADVLVSYQSRFDSRKWLAPFTPDVLEQLAVMGVKDVCIVTPGFVAENIESKVEAGEELREVFLKKAGDGASYTYVPTLNDDPGLINAMADAIEQAAGEK